MNYDKVKTYDREVTFHRKNNGEMCVGFYDNKKTGHIIPLYSHMLQPYFIFRGVRYNLNEQATEQLYKEFMNISISVLS